MNSHRVSFGSLLAIVIIGFAAFVTVAIAGSYLVYQGVADHAASEVDQRSAARSREKQQEFVRSCDRGNVVRAHNLIVDRHVFHDGGMTFRRDLLRQAILDCQTTVFDNANAPVPLPRAAALEYLRIYERGSVPKVMHVGEQIIVRPVD